jgi:hypothetical protein
MLVALWLGLSWAYQEYDWGLVPYIDQKGTLAARDPEPWHTLAPYLMGREKHPRTYTEEPRTEPPKATTRTLIRTISGASYVGTVVSDGWTELTIDNGIQRIVIQKAAIESRVDTKQ